MRHAALLLLVVAGVVALRQPLRAAPCPHPFTANGQSSLSYISYCVSDNGNIVSVVSPFNVLHIGDPPDGREGYGLCQENPPVEYHDYFTDASANWNPALILSSSSSSITISRMTADGNWTLVQTISKVVATGAIKVLMALTNNQSVEKVAYLLRFADTIDSTIHDVFGASLNSAWRWDNSGTVHYGLQLLNAAKSPFGYRQGFVRSGSSSPNPCDFASGAGGFFSAPGTMTYVYAGPVPAHGTKTVTLNYRGT